MRISRFNHFALSIYAAAAMLAGCTGSPTLISTPNTSALEQNLSHHLTFHYTGKPQTFKVPAGVKLISVDALGAGGGTADPVAQQGGRGGRVTAELPVAPGELLDIFVGGTASSSGFYGGYNGGGLGVGYASGYNPSYGGGGATDIREGGSALKDRILVAGGGGGLGGAGVFGYGNYGAGGQGGGKIAGNGQNGSGSKNRGCHTPQGSGGHGGTQLQGGSPGRGGCEGHDGRSGDLGNGGNGGNGTCCGGGGGGGGYYGGGGGGGGTYDDPETWEGTAGGGGGGSSYVEPRALEHQFWHGWKDATGNGEIVISW